MSRPEYFSPEYLDSFIAEHVSTYTTTNDALLRNPPERHRWTNEDISHIRRKLRKLTALRVLNAADAEDIVQDTLLALIRCRPKECLEKGPLAWSMGILRNKIGNYYRRSRYRAKCETGESEAHEELFQMETTASPDGELLRGELRNVIADTVERLPGAQKTAMKMLIAGLKPGEIAVKMSPEPYQTVINHLYRGRKKLAQELTRYGFNGMHEMKRSRGTKKRVQDKNESKGLSRAI